MCFFGIGRNESLKLRKPLYLCDSGDYWAKTMESFIKEVLGMLPLRGDNSVYALYDKHSTSAAKGLLGIYVDD